MWEAQFTVNNAIPRLVDLRNLRKQAKQTLERKKVSNIPT